MNNQSITTMPSASSSTDTTTTAAAATPTTENETDKKKNSNDTQEYEYGDKKCSAQQEESDTDSLDSYDPDEDADWEVYCKEQEERDRLMEEANPDLPQIREQARKNAKYILSMKSGRNGKERSNNRESKTREGRPKINDKKKKERQKKFTEYDREEKEREKRRAARQRQQRVREIEYEYRRAHLFNVRLIVPNIIEDIEEEEDNEDITIESSKTDRGNMRASRPNKRPRLEAHLDG
jgi:hypothetical protein